MILQDILPVSANDMVDFTCVTPWERLALDVELAMRKWRIDVDSIVASSAAASSSDPASEAAVAQDDPPPECVSLGAARTFSLTLHSRTAHQRAERILGAGRCVILGPPPDNADGTTAVDASDAASLLSALAVAASACGCELPTIVCVGPVDALRFIGRQVAPVPFRFSCDYTTYPPRAHGDLLGILALFHNKRSAASRVNPPPLTDVIVTSDHTFYWSDFAGFEIAPPLESFATDRTLASIHGPTLAVADPIKYLVLSALWDPFHAPAVLTPHHRRGMTMMPSTASVFRLAAPPQLSSSSNKISGVYLPLTTPLRLCLGLVAAAQHTSNARGNRPAAPRRLVNILAAASGAMPDISLAKAHSAPVIGEGLHLPSDAESYSNAVSSSSVHVNALEEDSAMSEGSRGTPSPPPRQFFQRAQQSRKGSSWMTSGPPLEEMDHFFAQAGEHIAAAAVGGEEIDEEFLTGAVASLFGIDVSRGLVVDVVEALGPGASELTVLELLARLAAAANSVVAAQRLWCLFLDGVELHWEQGWILHGVPFDVKAGPALGECLLLQKLQMINCCLDRIHQHASLGADSEGFGRKEVLDGLTLMGDRGLSHEIIEGASTREENGDDITVDFVEELLWEPIVQALPLVTRDLVEAEQSNIVRNAASSSCNSRSGSDFNNSEARRQSSALRSDMMSFKAANPGASMADFVRWFSPSDWLQDENDSPSCIGLSKDGEEEKAATAAAAGSMISPDESSKMKSKASSSPDQTRSSRCGRLSGRMCVPGNLWQEVWEKAMPIPAAKQVPLFDANLHGIKALNDLRAMPMHEVLRQFACVHANYAVGTLHRAFARPPELPAIRAAIEMARHAMVQAQLQLTGGPESLTMVQDTCEKLAYAEHMALCALSLMKKLPPGDTFASVINAVVSNESLDISTEQDRAALSLAVGLEQGGWRTPVAASYREYVLEGQINMDRMFCRVSSEEFRVGCRLSVNYNF
jgi:Rab3 GTPase-activating protein catalytic subunit